MYIALPVTIHITRQFPTKYPFYSLTNKQNGNVYLLSKGIFFKVHIVCFEVFWFIHCRKKNKLNIVPSRDVATIKENARVHIKSIVVHVESTFIKKKLFVLTRLENFTSW